MKNGNNTFMNRPGRILFTYETIVQNGNQQVIDQNIDLAKCQKPSVTEFLLNRDLGFIGECTSQPLTPRGGHFENDQAQEGYDTSVNNYNDIIDNLKNLEIQYTATSSTYCTDGKDNFTDGPKRILPKI